MISFDELLTVLRLALEHARRLGVEQVDCSTKDLYWDTDSTRYDVATRPELMLGSLVDDIAELQKVVLEPSRVSSVDLERMAAVLLAISESMAPDRG